MTLIELLDRIRKTVDACAGDPPALLDIQYVEDTGEVLFVRYEEELNRMLGLRLRIWPIDPAIPEVLWLRFVDGEVKRACSHLLTVKPPLGADVPAIVGRK